MKSGRVQAKDISDILMLRSIINMHSKPGKSIASVSLWDLHSSLGEYPRKVVQAKLNSLTKRGLLSGCACGCRGDFVITNKGYEVIK